MAPMISGSKKINNEIKFKNMNLQNKKDQLLKLRNFIENNFEYVGKNFSRKVREVYYDKKNNKTIYGTTTSEERKQLKEEGIELLSVPWINKDN
jgi:hypothetical protein